MLEYAVTTLVLRSMWAFAGLILGTYALISVWKRWKTVNMTVKIKWWVQVALTPLSGLFVLWLTFAFRGFIIQATWQIALVLIVSSLLALPNAFWLIEEAKKKEIAFAQVPA